MPEYAPPPGTPFTVHGTQLWVRTINYAGGIDEQGRPWRTACFLCVGEDVVDACNKLKGIIPGAVFAQPHRFLGNESLLCQDVRFELKGPKKTGPYYMTAPYAEIYANYGISQFDIYGDYPDQTFGGAAIPWTSWQVRGGEEIVPWPAAPSGSLTDIYVFQDDSPYISLTPDVRSLSRRVATKDYIVRRRKIADFVAFDAILASLQGKVNDDVWWGRPRGTFLLRPNDYDADYDPSGSMLGDFTMVFSWREVEHNAVPVPGHYGKFEVVTNPANDAFSHDYASFSPLLTYGIV